jgi:hypothetical protein
MRNVAYLVLVLVLDTGLFEIASIFSRGKEGTDLQTSDQVLPGPSLAQPIGDFIIL